MDKEPEMIQVDKPSMKVLLKAIGENYKCNHCGAEINENNFGIIHVDIQVCDTIICQFWGFDKLKELRGGGK